MKLQRIKRKAASWIRRNPSGPLGVNKAQLKYHTVLWKLYNKKNLGKKIITKIGLRATGLQQNSIKYDSRAEDWGKSGYITVGDTETMEPASSLFNTANNLFPWLENSMQCPVGPWGILYPIFLPLCCVIPSYKEPLQPLEPAAALCQLAALPCSVGVSPGQAQAFPGMEQSLSPLGGPHTEEHVQKQLPPAILPSSDTSCITTFATPKRDGAVRSPPQLLTTLSAKNLQNPRVYM